MISVFKTSVSNASDIEILKPLLDIQLENSKWNFDLEDCDNILRIDSLNEVTLQTIKLLKYYGFECEELSD